MCIHYLYLHASSNEFVTCKFAVTIDIQFGKDSGGSCYGIVNNYNNFLNMFYRLIYSL